MDLLKYSFSKKVTDEFRKNNTKGCEFTADIQEFLEQYNLEHPELISIFNTMKEMNISQDTIDKVQLEFLHKNYTFR